MCRKYLWCYVFILTLLDISLNVKLTAQGESHGKIDFLKCVYNRCIFITCRFS